MIDPNCKNIVYENKIKKFFSPRIKKTFVAVLFFAFLVLILIYLNNIVNPVIIHMSEAKVRSLTQKAISSSVYDLLSEGPIYDNLVQITRNDAGDPVLLLSNSLEINKITRELVNLSQLKLEVIGEKGVDIPLGSFSGMPIFVGRGPLVNIKLLPIGVVTCNFVSKFTTAGINQTNHRIYVNINSNVSVILPTANKTVTTTTQLLIAESIIVGKVPETYLQSESLDEMMNLIPN
ncbi:MAG: sporulation protein YunB [Clostridia bacterium]